MAQRRNTSNAAGSAGWGESEVILVRSLALQPIAEGNRFEFDANGIVDGNNGSRFEDKSRKHRAKLVNGRRIVAVQQHIPAPVAHADNEQLDLEIAGCLPLRKNFKIRFCAFSYSIGDPCGRSVQVSMYFIGIPLFALK